MNPSSRFDAFRLTIVFIVFVYVGLGCVYNAVNPVFEAPDEIWHYLYVRNIALGQGLPRQDWSYSDPLAQQEAAQPPLYYVTAGLLTALTPHGDLSLISKPNPSASIGDPTSDGNKNRFIHDPSQNMPWRGEILSVHVARAVSTLWGALAVILVALTATRLGLPRRVVIAATAAIAFTPQFLYLGAAVSNDATTAAIGGLLLFLAVRQSERTVSWRWSVLLGATAGLALLAKPLLLCGIGLVLLALLYSGLSHKASRRLILVHMALAMGSFAVVCGWWFARNVVLYGSIAPLNRFLARQEVTVGLPTLRGLIIPLPALFRSYWGLFGWFNIFSPGWFYVLFALLTAVALGGYLRTGVRLIILERPGRDRWWHPRIGRVLVVAWAGLVAVSLEAWLALVPAYQGRLAFGGIGAFSILLAVGWSELGGRRFGPQLALICAWSLLIPAALSPFGVIDPAYAPPPIVQLDQIPPESRVADQIGADIVLVGATITPMLRDLHPDQSVQVTLYWQAQHSVTENYYVFLQLLDWHETAIAKVDSYPGRGTFPTTLWPVGKIVADSYLMRVPPDVPVPTVGDLIVGMYRRSNLVRLPVADANGTAGGDWVSLGPAVFRGRTLQPPGRTVATFGDAIVLGNVSQLSTDVTAGSVLAGELDFVDLKPVGRDETVFVHLTGPSGLIAQQDGPPAGGAFPTEFWAPGDTVHHAFSFCIPRATPRGTYSLTTGFYDPRTMQRLTTATGDEAQLGTVTVSAAQTLISTCQ